MIVRIVKDWTFPDIMRQTPSHACEWNGVSFTEEKIEECDVLVVLNSPKEKITCKVRKGGLWLFSQESPIPHYQWHTKVFPYFDRVFTFWEGINVRNTEIVHAQTALPWHINKSYDELKILKPGIDKVNEISWITSNRTSKDGHVVRLNFLEFLQKNNFKFDLFGRGFKPIDDKFDGIFPYKYSIAMENYNCNDYWTEKIADCFLSWTLPFYYGCKNIYKYFPEKSLILLEPDKPMQSLEKMLDAINKNEWESRIGAIEEARNLILEKYQFFPTISKLIETRELGKRRIYRHIPKNTIYGLESLGLRETLVNLINR